MHQFHSEVISTTSLQAKNIEEAIAKTERLSSSIRDLLQPEGNVDLVQSVTPGHTWKARRNTSAKQSHPGSFTWKEIEAALCIWECLNDWTLSDDDTRKDWKALRESIGTIEIRYQSPFLARWLLKVYDLCTADDPLLFDGVAYDWEVIPLILDYARDSTGAPVIFTEGLPDPAETAELVKQAFAKNEWINDAIRHASAKWGYPGLITEFPESAEKARLSGETAEDYVIRIGEKYHLQPAYEIQGWK